MAKQKIHWWDSPGKYTCHKNELKLTFAESYLGEIFLASDGKWYVNVPYSIVFPAGGLSNSKKAKELLLAELGAEEVSSWDR